MTPKSKDFPLFILLTLSLLIGLFTFQKYGMTWDEYLYYQYADSIGYAYNIPAHFSEDFDINLAYGPSAGDHKNRGPAYLLIAGIPVRALHALTGIDKLDLWHLANFIIHLVGAYYLYKISLRWLTRKGAISATLFYLAQPMLWGHAFINPKDTPFTPVFVATLYYGFRFVDDLSTGQTSRASRVRQMLLVGTLIGIATNLRIIAPLLGVLLFLYALSKRQIRILFWFFPLAIISLITLYISWPYLWEAPLANFMEVLALMSNNPTNLKVLFYGNIYRAYELPLRYMPLLMGITLTEPTWLLFGMGTITALLKWKKEKRAWFDLGIFLFYFFFIVGYVLYIRPPMYDGFRHFLFILPPVFVLTGFAFEQLFTWTERKFPTTSQWLPAATLLIIASIGAIPIIKLYPYEYAYYNSFVGGISGAEGTFETEYWLTCYRETAEKFNELFPDGETLIVFREPRVIYAHIAENIKVIPFYEREEGDRYLLVAARLGENRKVEKNAQNLLSVGRDGATFCVVKDLGE